MQRATRNAIGQRAGRRGQHRERHQGRGPPGTRHPAGQHGARGGTKARRLFFKVDAPRGGRDVPGAPRPRERHRERHVYAGRRGRRPLPSCTTHTMSTHHAHAMPARTMAPMVGRDVPGAPRPRERHRGRHGDAGRRGRHRGRYRGCGPPGTRHPAGQHGARGGTKARRLFFKVDAPRGGRDVPGAPRAIFPHRNLITPPPRFPAFGCLAGVYSRTGADVVYFAVVDWTATT